MLVIRPDMKIYCYCAVTDMRKSIDTLSILVSDVLSQDPASGHLFLFRNRQGDKIKVLYYEQNCFTLWYRRLEQGKFVFPKDANGTIEMSESHFHWLLSSDKFSRISAMESKKYETMY